VAVTVDAPRVLGCEVHVLDLDRPVVNARELNQARRRAFVGCGLRLDFFLRRRHGKEEPALA
jgi:hypothetical protein